jgi:hypothetical protein
MQLYWEYLHNIYFFTIEAQYTQNTLIFFMTRVIVHLNFGIILPHSLLFFDSICAKASFQIN